MSVENVTDVSGPASDCLLHAEHSPPSPLLFYSVFSAFFFAGLVGNGLLIVVFLCHKSMRTTPNTYILNLAVADLLTTLSCASAPLLARAAHHLFLCRLFQLLLETSFGVTSFTLVALSVERYYAIARPLGRKVSSRTLTFSVVALTWLVSISYVVEKMSILKKGEGAKCVQMFNPSSFATSYTLIDFFALYFIPLVIIAVFYIMLAFKLHYSHSFIEKSGTLENQLPKHLKVRKRIALTVLILAAMFALFYFPFNYLSLRLYFDSGYVKNWDTSVNILFCVGCLHNCFNPYVLYTLSGSFRGYFNRYLFFCLNFRRPVQVNKDKEHNNSCECSECANKRGSCKVSISKVEAFT